MTSPSLRQPRTAGSRLLGLSALAGRLLRRFTLRQISMLTGLLGLAVLAGTFTFIGWSERQILFQEARDHADQSAAYLADHAQRLFEVSDLVLHATSTATAGLGWDEIGTSPEVRNALRRLDDMLPYVDSVFVADSHGAVRATTLDYAPPGYSVANRSVFPEAMAEKADDLLISSAIVGRVSGRPTFIVARRMNNPDGSFKGLVGAAMTLSYFTDYWQGLDKRNDEQIALVHAMTGSVLASHPPARDSDQADQTGRSLLAAIGAGQRSGLFKPQPHETGAFKQVGDLPVFITVVFQDAAIEAQWHAALRRLLPFAAGACLVLLVVIALARRLGRREEAARRQIETARAVLSAANSRLEQRVAERTADLLESNQEIQRFAYIVSHDLRAPLVNIMGFTTELQSLRDEVLDPAASMDGQARDRLRAEFDEAFGFILSSIDKMDRLIKAILALSRQGQRTLRPEALEMNTLMRSIADGVAHRVQQSGATITIGTLPSITADRIAVEQVFANLIDNAVKYLRPDVPGEIVIEGTATAAAACFLVRDNGRGIAPADRERVFDLFRRAGVQDQPGEGIGLANVRSLVRRLQGTITLDSALGVGCVFTVTLPRRSAEVQD